MSFYKEVPGRKTTLESTLKFDTEPKAGSTNPVTSDGVASGISQSMRDFEEVMYADQEIPASTLRFSFGDLNYDPTAASVGTGGTWTKKKTKFTNVWDWTNENTSWTTAFGGGSTTNPGAFADYENNPVKVIAAGDTSSVTDFSRFFQNCYAITEVCPIDTSGATTVFLMFSHCENCSKFPDMDFSNASDVRAVYQYCSRMVSAPDITLPTGNTYSLMNFFYGCKNLETVPLYNTSKCTEMKSMFSAEAISAQLLGTMHIKNIPAFDTSACTNMSQMFAGCVLLEQVPKFDTSACSNMDIMFRNCTSLKQIPGFNYSEVTSFSSFAQNCTSLTEIPEMNIEANATKCNSMFKNCSNIKSGQKALYDRLSVISTITDHTDCFLNCGSDTKEGRAELEQIPASWGGLAEG